MSDPRYPELYDRDEVRKSKSGVIPNLLAAIFGFIMPRHCCKLYLVKELQKNGMDTSAILEVCLQELTDEAIRQCKEQSSRNGYSWRSAITKEIETIALLIVCRLNGEDGFMSAMSWPNPFINILHKHGLLPHRLH